MLTIMKKILFVSLLLLFVGSSLQAQNVKKASIKFEKTTHNFGTFSEKDGVQTVVFSFTNVGESPLLINQAVASCGCTVPTYTKKPIQPGQKGEVKVSYNGAGKWPGAFKKTVSVMTNGDPVKVTLYIEGNMTDE